MTKRLFILLSLLYNFCACLAQETEFKIYENGLIYNVSTMNKLNHIVDSLNLKFKICEQKDFQSKKQGLAHLVEIEGELAKKALIDLTNKLPFDEFIKKYTQAKVIQNRCVTINEYKDFDNNEVLEFSEMNMNNGEGHEIRFKNDLKKYNSIKKGQWIFEYYKKTEYSKESISAFYFVEDIKAVSMNPKYSRMVQYSECMVDTNAQIFLKSARTNRYYGGGNEKKSKKVDQFLNYVNDFPNEPKVADFKKAKINEYDEDFDYEKYQEAFDEWNNLRLAHVENLSKTEAFKTKLTAALEEAVKNTIGNSNFEEYVIKYGSKEKALFLKRSRKVIGGCSQDQSPRFHAQDIAVLSAETANWEVFLRAYLDIMNDRFARVSDGSYAWGGRKTYIRELEELGINVPDLLLGISIRVENPSNNHYFGSINRLGRALAETKYKDEIEEKILSMVEDKELDSFNRILMYFLFRNYNHNLDDRNRKQENITKLKKAIETMPFNWAKEAEFKEEE